MEIICVSVALLGIWDEERSLFEIGDGRGDRALFWPRAIALYQSKKPICVGFRPSTQPTKEQRSLSLGLDRAIAQAYNHSDRSVSNYHIIIEEIERIVNRQKMAQITTTELPQTLQTLFIEVERTKTPLTVIHEGKPLVIIYPATTQAPRPTFGTMKGSGEIFGDLIAPVTEPWEVLK